MRWLHSWAMQSSTLCVHSPVECMHRRCVFRKFVPRIRIEEWCGIRVQEAGRGILKGCTTLINHNTKLMILSFVRPVKLAFGTMLPSGRRPQRNTAHLAPVLRLVS